MDSNDEVRWIVINPDSGEIIDKINVGDRIIRENSTKQIEKYKLNFNKGVSFLKIYDKSLQMMSETLSQSEMSCAMTLVRFISYEDCILKEPDGRAIQLKDFKDIFGLSYDRSRKIISSLVSKGVLGKFETGYRENPNKRFKCYVFNPYIATKGTRVNKEVIGLFQESQWANPNEE